MSSSTSSSRAHRRFAVRLLGLVLLPVAVLFGLSAYLQPLYGDLTRVGSFAENDYGWNKPQRAFTQPLYGSAPYDRHYDVVVLGDSFSTQRPAMQWQNYVVAATGWSVITLDINKMSLAQVLDSPAYRKTPPKVLVLETVERELPRRLKNEPSCDAGTLPAPLPDRARSASTVRSAKIDAHDLQGLVEPIERDTGWHEAKLGYVRNYLWKSFLRASFGRTHGNAEKVELAREAPFSSSIKDAMLVFRNDIRKARWWREMGVPEIGCRIARMRRQVEANKQTRFVFMVAPDKLTAYADFLRDADLRRLSLLAELPGRLPDIMPRLDVALVSAIRRGEEDVYLPDDTHWGSGGEQIAAETLMGFLQQP